MTLPRLELLAAVIASNLGKYVCDQLNNLRITKKVPWSDSQIVLCWLKSKKHLPSFVKRRVSAIRKFNFNEYRYCPTNENPADLLTRGITSRKLANSDLWWHGPEWLTGGDWPISETYDSAILLQLNADDETEPKELKPVTPPNISAIINVNDYGKLTKLLRVTALVQRFISNLQSTKNQRQLGELTSKELTKAEILWSRDTRRLHYDKEYRALKTKDKQINPLVRQLCLCLDDKELIRVGGRLQNAPIDYDAKFPYLLPTKCKFSELVIRDAHKRALHCGTETTMSYVRNNYWIPRLRITVRSILRKCVVCHLVMGKPYPWPLSAPLQSSRLNAKHPFELCGIDFTGHIFIKPETASPQREKKAYICVFTCAITRALHLEVVPDMTTEIFLLAFRRFTAQRSLPSKVISDNGSTFLSADKQIQAIMQSQKLEQFMANKRVDWSFIPKRMPWATGFVERMVGITKNCLKKVLGRSFLNLEELRTVVTEEQCALNNRPITYCSSDITDTEPLTPSHFLHGRVLSDLPRTEIDMDELNDPTFALSQLDWQKRANRLTLLKNAIWTRWKTEYLNALRERHLAKREDGKDKNIIKVGDIVLVHDDLKKRIQWKLAHVERLTYGNDGLVRSAQIKTQNGTTNRPIVKLYPLEVSDDSESPKSSDDPLENDTKDNESDSRPSRPTRRAALKAKDNIKEWSRLLSGQY
ncbi:uncharacterized protein LOC135498660 [Lineus longissimus]|uniref:uncharacterized protein LOC135498660 n=1 Tax=Lineus longissimus TaxID=88925 RepID=UPI00315D5126